MRSDRLFAKLNAGTTFRGQRSSPDSNAIRWQDVVGACQGLDGLAWLVARYLWSGDDMAGAELLVNAEAMARGMGFKNETARKVAGVVMVEMKDLACSLCRGAGEVQVSEHKRETCPACKGYARRAMSQRERAKYAGIAETSWRRTYARRYEAYLNEFVRAKHRAETHVIRGLGDA